MGNSESQSYTSAADNVSVAGGNENYCKKVGSYTSARLKSENKFEFTYGRLRLEQAYNWCRYLAHMDVR
jgi:beta-glucanase (GH16 family)